MGKNGEDLKNGWHFGIPDLEVYERRLFSTLSQFIKGQSFDNRMSLLSSLNYGLDQCHHE